MKTTSNITLYDLMAEDFDVNIEVNKKFGLDLKIDDEHGNLLIYEQGINDAAAESFARFCEEYLLAYNHAFWIKNK